MAARFSCKKRMRGNTEDVLVRVRTWWMWCLVKCKCLRLQTKQMINTPPARAVAPPMPVRLFCWTFCIFLFCKQIFKTSPRRAVLYIRLDSHRPPARVQFCAVLNAIKPIANPKLKRMCGENTSGDASPLFFGFTSSCLPVPRAVARVRVHFPPAYLFSPFLLIYFPLIFSCNFSYSKSREESVNFHNWDIKFMALLTQLLRWW
jgi:hypothetical protein